MSLLTPFYKLKKLLLTDSPPDITQLNDNWDTIDTELNNAQAHREDAGIHVAPLDKLIWDSKAEGAHNHRVSNITSGTLGVARGGTGRATHTSDYFLRGNGTSAVKLSSPATVLSDIGAMPAQTAFKAAGNLGYFSSESAGNAALDAVTAENHGGATAIIASACLNYASTNPWGWAGNSILISHANGGYGPQLIVTEAGLFWRVLSNGTWGSWRSV